MAFGIGAVGWSAIAAGTSAAVGAYSADQSRKAGNQSADNAKSAADQQQQQFNKLNGKQPDIAALADQNMQAGKNGPSGTLLTGPSGVDPSKLTLGRNTLLGAPATVASAATLGGG